MSIKCAHCKNRHSSVEAVKACAAGALTTCHWMVERPEVVGGCEEYGFEVEWGIVDCGAEAVVTERGWTCAAGHSFVTATARREEGWEYAEDFGEAMALARAGVEPLTMSGHTVLGPQSFERG